ncbi:hypothetical protein ACS0TY_023098 [Phlomoides rotata]
MVHRLLEITLQYAKDLHKVNLISKMDVYVVVSISGGDKNSKQRIKTAADHGGDANPMWRFTTQFAVEEAALLQNRLVLDFELKCERALKDRAVGEVHVPVKDLLDFPANGGAGKQKFVSYQVKKPNGKPKGQLTFSYRFRDKTAAAEPPLPPVEEPGSVSMIAYPVVESISPCPAPVPGGYQPAGGLTPLEWLPPPSWWGYPPPPPPLPSPPVHGYVYPPPPPLMQLGPNWWIVDWRYDFRCS